MSTCQACAAPIRWVITEAGKAMPIDAEPVPDGNIIMTGRTVRTRGGRLTPEVGYLTEGTLFPSDATRYVSHFATCTHPEQFRKAKR